LKAHLEALLVEPRIWASSSSRVHTEGEDHERAPGTAAASLTARSPATSEDPWGSADTLVVALLEQCRWEPWGSAEAALLQLSIQMYDALAGLPKPALQQVQRAMRHAKLPLCMPKGLGEDGDVKGGLLLEWQSKCGNLLGISNALGVSCLGLLAEGLVHGLPAAFACNIVHCENLEGLAELALVTGRAQVVCGRCEVARYCCRQCQEEDYALHEDICRVLRKRRHKGSCV
jgi:hypothetical protein